MTLFLILPGVWGIQCRIELKKCIEANDGNIPYQLNISLNFCKLNSSFFLNIDTRFLNKSHQKLCNSVTFNGLLSYLTKI